LDAVEATVSLNQRVGDGEAELGDLFVDPDAADPEGAAVQLVRSLEVRRAIEKLPEHERKVVELRFGLDEEPMSLEAVGRELGIKGGRVRQLERQALEKLADELGDLVAADVDELANAA
jgi:RNA polymerase primary sigma factor